MKRCTFGEVVWVLAGLALTGLAGSRALASENQQLGQIAYSTPPGITLVEVAARDDMKIEVFWLRLGDGTGRTLFVSDDDTEAGVSTCTGKCLEDFPPVLAPARAQAYGDWSLIEREGEQYQWAYKNQPLYRFARETRVNEVVDNLLALREKSLNPNLTGNIELEKDALLPPEGWHVARFDPVGDQPMPSDVQVKDLPAASSLALVDVDGMTLYRFTGERDGPDKCGGCGGFGSKWRPLEAAQAANPVGRFSPVSHEDGSRQWAYDGTLLFTFAGDVAPGDINGIKQADDSRWEIVAVAQHFVPPVATVRYDRNFGPILSSAKGLPLYSRYTVERLVFVDRTEDDILYTNGKELGIKGCDSKCLETWRPLLASEDAQSRGFWEIVDRGDGTRQWAYKGFVQFTHINDRPFEGVRANNQYVYVVGDKGRYKVADTLMTGSMAVTAGFQWRVSDIHPR